MLQDQTKQRGLWVAGVQQSSSTDLLSSMAQMGNEASRTRLASPLALEIVEAMMASSVAMRFADIGDVLDNILFRIAAVLAMQSLTTGTYDCDYFNPDIDLKPRIGTTDSTRVSKYWSFLTPSDIWDAEWKQAAGTVAHEAIGPQPDETIPFRGECAGAFQLCVYWGLLNGLGAKRFDEMAERFGTMYVGPWRLGKVQNPATYFMQTAPLQDPPIPGDYLYFKNKDDYPTLAPNGFWQGLNSMYVGKDMLGTRHYSGMGACWQSESNLRMELANAYYHDCYPHRIDHPLTEVRFTERNILQIPGNLDGVPPMTNDGSDGAAQLTPKIDELLAKGYAVDDAKAVSKQATTVGEFADALGIEPTDIRQHISASKENPSGRVNLNGYTAIVEYRDADADRHDPGAKVSVHLLPKSGS